MTKLDHAVLFATDAHKGQRRKGAPLPYIIHPMEVMTLVHRMGGDETLQIAAVLHDTVEDTSVTADDIAETFGPEVHLLVCNHTEDKTKTWQVRKESQIAHVQHGDIALKKLILADKISNLRSMVQDRRANGESFWDNFHAPKERQKWFYAELWNAFLPLENDPLCGPFLDEYKELYDTLFAEESLYTIPEKMAFYKKKWLSDHMSLLLAAALVLVVVCMLGILMESPYILSGDILLLAVLHGWRHNAMMTYAEKRTYPEQN